MALILEHSKSLGMSEDQLDIEIVSKARMAKIAIALGDIEERAADDYQPLGYISMNAIHKAGLVVFSRRDCTQGDHFVRIFDKVRQTELKDFFGMIAVSNEKS